MENDHNLKACQNGLRCRLAFFMLPKTLSGGVCVCVCVLYTSSTDHFYKTIAIIEYDANKRVRSLVSDPKDTSGPRSSVRLLSIGFVKKAGRLSIQPITSGPIYARPATVPVVFYGKNRSRLKM